MPKNYPKPPLSIVCVIKLYEYMLFFQAEAHGKFEVYEMISMEQVLGLKKDKGLFNMMVFVLLINCYTNKFHV